jgi:hypothetical protein
MPLVAGERVHFHAPVPRHPNGYVRRRAEAIEAQPSASLQLTMAETTESDNPGAQQRRRLLIGKLVRNRVDEILRRDHVLGVASVDGVASELGMLAEVLFTGAAILATAVGTIQSRNADAGPKRVSSGAGTALFDYADGLMARRNRGPARRQLAFNDVQVRTANTANLHPDENLAWAGSGDGAVATPQGVGFHRGGSMEYPSLHPTSMLPGSDDLRHGRVEWRKGAVPAGPFPFAARR